MIKEFCFVHTWALLPYNISGQTICSAFHKKMYKGTYNHLSADELNTFRIKYRHLKVVIF